MSPQAQEALVTIYRAIEQLGKRPTNPVVFRTVRDLGYAFRDREAKLILAAFRKASAPAAPRCETDVAPEITFDGTDSAPNGDRSGRGLRVRDKGIPSSNLDFVDKSTQSQPKQQRLGLGLERMQKRDAIIAALWPAIDRSGLRMTKTAWRQRNNKAALDLVDAGFAPEEVLAAYHEHGRYTLSQLHAKLAAASVPQRQNAPKLGPGETIRWFEDGSFIIDSPNDPRPLHELLAAGAI